MDGEILQLMVDKNRYEGKLIWRTR